MKMLGDLFEICKENNENYDTNYSGEFHKEIWLKIDGKDIELSNIYCIIDGIFYIEIGGKCGDLKDTITTREFVDLIENECWNDKDTYFNNMYVAPIDIIKNFELRIVDYIDTDKIIDKYEIEKIENKEDITIYLKTKEIRHKYESMIILAKDTSAEQYYYITKKIEEIFGNNFTKEIIGIKKLAYEIKHNGISNSTGLYIDYKWQGTKNQVENFERLCRINDIILKYITVREED